MKYVLLGVLITLMGCASADVTGDSTERDYRDLVNIEDNTGFILMLVDLTAASEQETATRQDNASDPTVSPETSASLAKAGATAQSTLGAAAKSFIEALSNAFTPDNSVDNSVSTPPAVTVPDNDQISEPTGNVIETIEMRELTNHTGRSQGWLLHNGGAYEGFTVLFDNNCGVIPVPDSSLDVFVDGNNSNQQQALYYSGNSFVPGEEGCSQEGDKCRAAVWTPPGCLATTAKLVKM